MKQWSDLKYWDTATKLRDEVYSRSNDVLPLKDHVFNAFHLTPFDEVKCVILGQDPYPTKGHANGLAFSCLPHVNPLPPSLRNIYREYQSDLGFQQPVRGVLSNWADNGVLLLNTILTVTEGKSLAHKGVGWEKLTIEVLSSLNRYRDNLVFILWGKYAQSYQGIIDSTRHFIITSPHPSPYSANTGFFGSKPFSNSNRYLTSKGIEPINWRL